MENEYNPALDKDFFPYEQYRMRVYHEYVYNDGTRDNLDSPIEARIIVDSMPQAWLEDVITHMANKIICAYAKRAKGDQDDPNT